MSSKIKDRLLAKIASIDDNEFLSSLYELVDDSYNDPIELNETQINRLNEARNQIDSGESIKHDELVNQIYKWLEK